MRCGLISQQDYLETLGRSITNLLRTLGRMKQTVAEASWDAWIKYYRQDENSPNALVSYYLKGSLIALCLDLLIRSRTRGRKSLDDLMLALWERHGQTGVGVPEDGIEKLAEEIAGARLRTFFDKALRSTDELPLKQWLATVGLEMQLRPAEAPGDKGGKPAQQPPRELAARVALGARTAEDPAGRAADPRAGRGRGAGRRALRRRRAGRDRRSAHQHPQSGQAPCPVPARCAHPGARLPPRRAVRAHCWCCRGRRWTPARSPSPATDAAARRRRERWLAGE